MGPRKATRRRAQKTALPWEYDDAHCVAEPTGQFTSLRSAALADVLMDLSIVKFLTSSLDPAFLLEVSRTDDRS
jgi:hypothetical protein